MKPQVLVTLLCSVERHGWIAPDLAMLLVNMGRDSRFETTFATIMDYRPHEYARNVALQTARDQGNFDWLIQVDNDTVPHVSPLDVIALAPKDADVIGMPYGTTAGRQGLKFFPAKIPSAPFEEVDAVGGGCLMIRSTVWRTIPRGPWFQWQTIPNSETLECACGEDVDFCNRVRAYGMHVCVHRTPAAHFHTQDISAIANTLQAQQQPTTLNLCDMVVRGAQR